MADIAQTRARFATEGTYTPDNLIVGDLPVRTRKVTLVSGQNVVRGAVLGIITTGGKYTLSLSAAGDGSNTPRAIAAEDVDASGGDKDIVVYISGDFNETRLTFGTAHTADSTREGLRGLGIFLHKPVAA